MSSEFNFINIEGDDCSSKGRCTLSPFVVSLQELVLHFTMLASYYLLELEAINLYNNKLKYEIINNIASLVYINEYNEVQMYDLVMRCYYIYTFSRNKYTTEYNKNKISTGIKNPKIDFGENFTMPKAISSGDLLLKKMYNHIPGEKRNYIQIFYTVLKSVCQSISKLFDFNVYDDDAILKILKILAESNLFADDMPILTKYVNTMSAIDEQLKIKLANSLFDNFGNISEVIVSHSTRKGKCILVSGNNFNDLIAILEQTKDMEIDVYTHSNLIISHSLEKFMKYPNLRGHYGRSNENCIVDYATFPGSILLTKNSKNNTEYLYRGKIFSNDYIAPQGVIKLENNDYKPVIETSLNSVGFKKGQQRPDTKLGFNEKEIDLLFDKIFSKLESEKLKRLYIIGVNSFHEFQKEYFKIFLSNLRTDEYGISFYYESEKNNVFTINIGNYVPLCAYIMNKIYRYNNFKNRLYFIFPTCDIGSISTVIRLSELGYTNIHIASCFPTVINPSAFDIFIKKYDLRKLNNALDDLKTIRKNTLQ